MVTTAVVASKGSGKPRGIWLRIGVFATILGGVMNIVYGWMQAHQNDGVTDIISGQRMLHLVGMPLLSVAAVAGMLLMERVPTLGTVLVVTSTLISAGGGGFYLVAGGLIGCAWAAHNSNVARALLGLALLSVGVAATYIGIMATLSVATGTTLPGLPVSLSPPTNLNDALAPLLTLPVAFIGGWLLLVRRPASR